MKSLRFLLLLLLIPFLPSCSTEPPQKTHGPSIAPTVTPPKKTEEVKIREIDKPLARVEEKNEELHREVVLHKEKAKTLTVKISDLQEVAGENEALQKGLQEARLQSVELESALKATELLVVEQEARVKELREVVDEKKGIVDLLEAERDELRLDVSELNERVSKFTTELIPKIEGERDAAFNSARDFKTELERVKRWRNRLFWIVLFESVLLAAIGYLFFSSSGLSLLRPFLRK